MTADSLVEYHPLVNVTAAPGGIRLSKVSPSYGLPGGGTAVTITGVGFQGATGVRFGNVAGTIVSVNSPGTSMRVTSPPGAGTVESDGPVLYVEFRKDGGSIDPGPWWSKSQGEKVRG